MKKTIGILGGMGPEATAYMYNLIIKHTQVETDQDHIRVIIFSNPEIPPRTDAILGKGLSPVPLLIEGIRKLKDAGADFVIMPCVTAHYFIPEVLTQIDVPFLSLLDESLSWAKENLAGLKRVGLISSTGTLVSKLFHHTFGKAGIEVLALEDKDQQEVMEAIFGPKGIKAGFSSGPSKEQIVRAAEKLTAGGAEAILAGCTELPLVLKAEDISVPLIEPMEILAQKSILEAGYKVR
ncbi:MAG: amino acid racemase [Candidatus Aminicenantes bacterium]|nr:amino acid racemase [Candidatus Aminicenantes bacterium]